MTTLEQDSYLNTPNDRLKKLNLNGLGALCNLYGLDRKGLKKYLKRGEFENFPE